MKLNYEPISDEIIAGDCIEVSYPNVRNQITNEESEPLYFIVCSTGPHEITLLHVDDEFPHLFFTRFVDVINYKDLSFDHVNIQNLKACFPELLGELSRIRKVPYKIKITI